MQICSKVDLLCCSLLLVHETHSEVKCSCLPMSVRGKECCERYQLMLIQLPVSGLQMYR